MSVNNLDEYWVPEHVKEYLRRLGFVLPLDDMEKFEVGLQGDIRKVLFLTDKSGKRHKIAETQKGDALQEEFDKAYEAVRAHFNNGQEA